MSTFEFRTITNSGISVPELEIETFGDCDSDTSSKLLVLANKGLNEEIVFKSLPPLSQRIRFLREGTLLGELYRHEGFSVLKIPVAADAGDPNIYSILHALISEGFVSPGFSVLVVANTNISSHLLVPDHHCLRSLATTCSSHINHIAFRSVPFLEAGYAVTGLVSSCLNFCESRLLDGAAVLSINNADDSAYYQLQAIISIVEAFLDVSLLLDPTSHKHSLQIPIPTELLYT
jgi:hypothetical protein